MHIAKWGNNFAVRLPADIVKQLGLKEGDKLELEVKDGRSSLAVAPATGYRICDALIVSAALQAGCTTLYPEDLQTGRVIDGRLAIRNPFGSAGR